MTTQLAPLPVFRGFDNNGNPLIGGQLFSYVAGTTTPQATWVDSTQTTQNTNPIKLNARGEANVWLDPTKIYKFVLQDSSGNQIWAVDQIVGGVNLTQANIGAILYPQTAAEIAAGVTPVNLVYPTPPPYIILERYGLTQTGLANACLVAQQIATTTFLVPTVVIDAAIPVTSNLTIPAGVNIKFVGQGQLQVASAATVTYNGYVEAGRQAIFTLAGAGIVNFSGSFQRDVRPEWWGAKGDGATDDYVALTNCLTQASNMQGRMLITALHACGTTLFILSNVEIIGEGRNLATGFLLLGLAQIYVQNFRSAIKGLAIYASQCTALSAVLINNVSGNCYNNKLEDIIIFGVNVLAGNLIGVITQECQDILLSRVRVDISTGGSTAGPVTANITAITQASSAVVTVSTVSAVNPFSLGTLVYFSNTVGGMTQIQNQAGTIQAIGGSSGAWTAQVNINSSAYTAYTSGGTLSCQPTGINIQTSGLGISIYKADIELAYNGIVANSGTGDVTIEDAYIERHLANGMYIAPSSASSMVRVKGGSIPNPTGGQNSVLVDLLNGSVQNVDIDAPQVFTTGGGVLVTNGTAAAPNVNIRGVPAGRINNPNGYAQVKGSGPFSGVAAFSAATTAAVTFITPLLNNTSYRVALSQSATSTSPPWITSKTVSGFTINFGANFTGNVEWTVDQ